MKLDCEFIVTPRILFNDKRLSRTDIDVLSLIISFALKSIYCFASNKYLSSYINTSTRTISDSLSKLKKLGYIIVKNDNRKRKIFLNKELIPVNCVGDIATPRKNVLAISCGHNINNKIKSNYKGGKLPTWITNSDICKEEPLSDEELNFITERLNKYK